VAGLLKEAFDLEVDLIPGNRGEFTVWLDGREVVTKTGDDFPPEHDIESAVHQALEKS
jgi:hypothetical protein